MKHKDILVSTVIPSYKNIDFLEETILSILNQTHENQEVIIVNDYPNGEHIEKLHGIIKVDNRIRIINNIENKGNTISRNIGIEHAKGKYIAFLDNDDLWHDKEKLEKQINRLEQNTNIGLIGTQFNIINTQGEILKTVNSPCTDKEIRNLINFAMPILQSSFMFPIVALNKVGRYDEQYTVSQDYDMVFRMGKLGSLENVGEVCTSYRVHNNNIGVSQRHNQHKNGREIIKNHGHSYPNYHKALLLRALIKNPYEKLRPHIPKSRDIKMKDISYKIAQFLRKD